MNSERDQILGVPTNIITGFLGVGKTSAILHLLSTKPATERWAVLVNEFGEIGVDGSLIESQLAVEQGIYVREVPGGCMCCTAGVSLMVALNDLLIRARPDRLLIEPTGLGHPREVLQVLSSEAYRDVLDLGRTLTLVDARKLNDARYTLHDTFNQQIAMADTVVGNKEDLYNLDDRQRLLDYVEVVGKPHANVLFTQHGRVDPELLIGGSSASATQPYCAISRSSREKEGYLSRGWCFDGEVVFNREKLVAFLSTLEVERMKGVFVTDAGSFGYNLTPDGIEETVLSHCADSRVEMIAAEIDPEWEAQLLSCRL